MTIFIFPSLLPRKFELTSSLKSVRTFPFLVNPTNELEKIYHKTTKTESTCAFFFWKKGFSDGLHHQFGVKYNGFSVIRQGIY